MKDVISYGHFRCQELAPHKNRGMEITYIEKGMLEWMAEGRPEPVETGSIYFTLPWQVHGSVKSREPENFMWHVLFRLAEDYPKARPEFAFPASLGFSPDETAVLSSTFAKSRKHCFPATPFMQTLMPTLIGELQSTHELRDAHAATLLRAVLVELKRTIAGDVLNAERYTPSEQKVQALIANLSVSCDQPWSLAEMAEQCGIQRTQLNKVFQKLTGSTPMEYLFRIRMERAKTLLRETDMKIIEIAFDCGYGTSQYFANTFRQATGVTPSQYRKHSGELSDAESRYWKNVKFRSEEEERQRVRSFSSDK